MITVTGRVKFIGNTLDVSASFSKRELVVTTEEQYPQHILLEFTQDKTELLDDYNVGDSVEVSINIRGREWVNPQGESKYFNTLQGWRIKKTGQAQPQPQTPPANNSIANNANDFKEEEHDDLPF